ncbi:MAG TPA: hypothetical protein VGD26_14060 [Chitinophagaceae bacterium]
MKLRINAKDHNLVEDELGNPVFRFLGIWPCDLNDILNRVNTPSQEIEELKYRLEEAEDELREIRDMI